MHILIRVFGLVFCVWLVCRYFYSLGRKSAAKDKKTKSRPRRPGSKVVESSVVEDTDNDVSQEE